MNFKNKTKQTKIFPCWTLLFHVSEINYLFFVLTWNNGLVPNQEEVHQGCIFSSCLFKFYAEYIMWNAWLDEAQAGIKVSGRKINNLRYTDDTTLMAETKELKSLLKVKEESEKVCLKLNIQKTKILVSCSITSWEIDGETMTDFIFGGAPKSLQMVTAVMKLKDACSLEEKLWST